MLLIANNLWQHINLFDSPSLLDAANAGDDKQWDAKLTDFGLHATVEALDTSSVSRSV